MLNALGILGNLTPPSRSASGSHETSHLPPTPITSGYTKGRSRYPARSLLGAASGSKRARKIPGLEAGKEGGDDDGKTDHEDWPSSPTPPRRSSRIKAKVEFPPTPQSLPALSPKQVRAKRRKRVPAKSDRKLQPLSDRASTWPEVVQGPTEEGRVEQVRKIHLIQERLRDDPWRMLVAVYLLNKTTGRAANPIREEIFRRWPSADSLAQASIPDLAELLYPLGLFNQRANSLIRFSQQYVQLGWPIRTTGTPLPASMDVTVFYGAGRYASDSFRIYSPLLSGRGAPQQEQYWVDKRARALERRCLKSGVEMDIGEVGVEDIGEWMSDVDESYDSDSASKEEEWRKVRPTDKELRRYLVCSPDIVCYLAVGS